MSSILENGNNKKKCQKFTPDSLVKTMLDLANYDTNLMGKSVLENSFGSGNILKAIVVRYIESAQKAGVNKEEISNGLSNDIYGLELDKKLFDNCLIELNSILQQYSLPEVEWKLFNDNALLFDYQIKFDYIIGNPPYISYKEMDTDSRDSLKKKFTSCNIGKFDYCYAFIELGINLLKENGKLVQLIPNNIYKNVFAKKLRDLLTDHIAVIYDYPDQKLFDKALTSVSIFLYDKTITNCDIKYRNVTDSTELLLNRTSLGNKWTFINNQTHDDKKIRFGDVFHASITIATLCNKAFLVDQKCIDDEKIEQGVLRKSVSPKSLRYDKEKQIIFPYKYENNVLIHYTENDFKTLFPNATAHLENFLEDLKKRDSDKNALWFEYGRSQALSHLYKEKLLISSVITNRVEVYRVDADTIPFSGIYITAKDANYTLDDAMDILNSDAFMAYIKSIGISISGRSLRITCKDVNNYLFSGGQ